MHIYKFYDSDITGQEEYDISGKQYIELLEVCFKYCYSVAVLISPNYVDNIGSWQQHQIPISMEVQRAYSHYGKVSCDTPNRIRDYEIRHYRLDENLKKKILRHTDSIFKWICGWGYNNPNDLTFFRGDGSVFFAAIVHEGECTLMPNDNEDISTIVTQGPWVLI